MTTRVDVNAELISWAIDRAGFDFSEIIRKNPVLEQWLSGDKRPTVKQLQAFSKKVYVPFGYLLLDEPPKEKLSIPFFRTLNQNDQKISLNISETIQTLKQRQEWLRDYLLDNQATELPFVGRFKNATDVDAIVRNIRHELGLDEQGVKQFSGVSAALNALVERSENIGIMISFNGVVANNTRRKITIEECRGFVLVDGMAPFMFINNADFLSAQLFTLAHELAHIWIGQSAGFDFHQLQPAGQVDEHICDQIAAEFLVPKNALLRAWKKSTDIKLLAKEFKVSSIVIARRALDLHQWTKPEFFAFYETYQREEFKKHSPSSGGNFYATTRKRLGKKFMAHIKDAVQSEQLLYPDAYKLTELQGDTFHTFMEKYAEQ